MQQWASEASSLPVINDSHILTIIEGPITMHLKIRLKENDFTFSKLFGMSIYQKTPDLLLCSVVPNDTGILIVPYEVACI